MALKVWDGDDIGYENWVKTHPQGFVANTRRPRGGRYFKIHLSTHNLADRSKPETKDPRTGNRYLKLTSDTFDELRDWAASELRIIVDQSNCCKQCGPRAGSNLVL